MEAEVRASSVLTLDELNRVLAVWLEVAYHQQVNRETGQTPQARYEQEPRLVRQVDLSAVLGFFQQRVVRTVDEDHSDVRLENLFFAVDPKMRGDKLIVQYDPFSPLEEVQLYSQAGVYLGCAKRYQREPGAHPPAPPAPPAGPVTPHYLDALRAEHEALEKAAR